MMRFGPSIKHQVLNHGTMNPDPKPPMQNGCATYYVTYAGEVEYYSRVYFDILYFKYLVEARDLVSVTLLRLCNTIHIRG